VVVFLSGSVMADGTPISAYFQSLYCRHEFMAAVKYKKRIVILCETEAAKGGIPLSAHLDEARKHPALEAVAAVLSAHAEQGWVVPWRRIRVFQDVSLKLALAPIVCGDSGRVDAMATRQGADVFIPTEVVRRSLGPLPAGCQLYVSRFNPGAADVARLVASSLEASGPKMSRARRNREAVRWTDNPETETSRFLLLLNASTWDANVNPDVDQLFEELKRVVKSGLSKWLLLVSDQRGSAAVPFDHIIGATPRELMKARGAGGIYDTVATDLYSEPHRAVSIRLVLDQLVGSKSKHSLAELAPRPQRLVGTRSRLKVGAQSFTERLRGASGRISAASGEAQADENGTLGQRPSVLSQLDDSDERPGGVQEGLQVGEQGKATCSRIQVRLPDPAPLPPPLASPECDITQHV